MEDEGVLFEGLRLGSAQAFSALLGSYDPPMRRLARLYVPDDQVEPLLRQTWSTALSGLDMFTWHTTLRAWVTGIFVSYGRAWHTAAAGAHRATDSAVPPVVPRAHRHEARAAGPVPWSSLRWSDLWGPDGWRLLEDVMAAQPLGVREVLWLRDVEGWSWREVLDALGLTAAQGEDLLLSGRSALAAAVVLHVGADPDHAGNPRERSDGVAALLAALRPVRPGRSLHPELQRLFGVWRRRRGVRPWRRWRWELTRDRETTVDLSTHEGRRPTPS